MTTVTTPRPTVASGGDLTATPRRTVISFKSRICPDVQESFLIPTCNPFPQCEEGSFSAALPRCGVVTRRKNENMAAADPAMAVQCSPNDVHTCFELSGHLQNHSLNVLSSALHEQPGVHADASRLVISGKECETLRDAYQVLVERQQLPEALRLRTDVASLQLVEWALGLMAHYASEPRKALDKQGVPRFTTLEMMYGGLIMELVATQLDNTQLLCSETQLCSILVTIMDVQRDPPLVQNAVHTAAVLCKLDPLYSKTFAKEPRITEVLLSVLCRGRIETAYELAATDKMLPARLELVQCIASEARIFENTSIFKEIIALWNRLDKQSWGRLRYQTTVEAHTLRKQRLKTPRGELYWDAVRDASTTKTQQASVQRGASGVTTSTTPTNAASPLRHLSSSGFKLDTQYGSLQHEADTDGYTRLDLMMLFSHTLPLTPRRSAEEAVYQQAKTPGYLNRTVTSDVFDELPLVLRVSSSVLDSDDDSVLDVEDTVDREDPQYTPSPLYSSPTKRKVMAHLFALMVKVVSPGLLATVSKTALAFRLYCISIDVETVNPTIVANALFTLGMILLSPNNALQSVDAIEMLCDVVRCSYQYREGWACEIVGYGCLVSASLCTLRQENALYYVDNSEKIRLLVCIIDKRTSYHDFLGINGVCALICNLVYKNDEVKSQFGKAGICDALTKALQTLSSPDLVIKTHPIYLFQAIGNIGLHSGNCARFLDAGLPKAYRDYLGYPAHGAGCRVLEACCKTLANLVIEHDHAETFQECLSPLLELLRLTPIDEETYTFDTYVWIFEIMGNLCRWPSTAQRFAKDGGIQVVFNLVARLPYSETLYTKALYVLRNQVFDPEASATLVEQGVLEFCRRILDHCVQRLKIMKAGHLAEELSTTKAKAETRDFFLLIFATLRCLYHVITTVEHAQRCIDMKCMTLLLQLHMLNTTSASLASDIYCVFFKVFALFHDYSSAAPAAPAAPAKMQPCSRTVTSGKITPLSSQRSLADKPEKKNEKVPSNVAGQAALTLRRQISLQGTTALATPPPVPQPRQWQTLPLMRSCTGDRLQYDAAGINRLGLSPGDIEDFVTATRLCLTSDKFFNDLRFCKLATGFLTYVAYECPSEALYRSLFGYEQAEVLDEVTREDRPRSMISDRDSPSKPRQESLRGPPPKKSPWYSRRRSSWSSCFVEDTDQYCKVVDSLALVKHIQRCFSTYKDRALLEECTLLLNQLVMNANTPERLAAILDTEFLRDFKKAMYKDDVFLDLAKESFCIYRLIYENRRDPESVLSKEASLRHPFSLDLSGWTTPSFLDGVHNLPAEVKAYLRRGCKLTMVASMQLPNKWSVQRSPFVWRSSHDLMELQWRTDYLHTLGGDEFPNCVPISCCSSIYPGLLPEAPSQRELNSTPDQLLCLSFNKQRLNLPLGSVVLRMKGKKERDALLHVLTLWRDSAQYGI